MRILLYGRLADVLGREIELPDEAECSIAELRERLAAYYPKASEAVLSKRVRACIGDAIVPESHVVGPGEMIEFFPPVSGG